jgi:hypothetical protein
MFGGMMMPGYGGYFGFEGSLVPYLNGFTSPAPMVKMKDGGGFGSSLKERLPAFLRQFGRCGWPWNSDSQGG